MLHKNKPKTSVIWHVPQCPLLNRYRYCTDTCCVHLQDRRVLVIWEHFVLYLLLSLHISEMGGPQKCMWTHSLCGYSLWPEIVWYYIFFVLNFITMVHRVNNNNNNNNNNNWKQNTAQVIQLVTSSRGVISKLLSQSPKRLNLHPNTYIQMQKSVILGTCSVVKKIFKL
jgi:hypothetical protein